MDFREHTSNFKRDGYVLIPKFYDVKSEIAPIHDGIQKIIKLIAKKYRVDAPSSTPIEAMTEGYLAIIKKNREWGGEVYDAIKQIPSFMRLVSNPKNDAVFSAIRPDAVPGLAAAGYGIRIDNPTEQKFRAPWHQEFPAQLRSQDGLVFWSPLLTVTQDMGPVDLAVGSHAEGIIPVYNDTDDEHRSGAYALRLEREDERLARYKHIAPTTEPGDLLIMDFLTLHQSGENRSDRPRWTMQFRYFNYSDPIGIRIGWRGSFGAGIDFADVIPELLATAKAGR